MTIAFLLTTGEFLAVTFFKVLFVVFIATMLRPSCRERGWKYVAKTTLLTTAYISVFLLVVGGIYVTKLYFSNDPT